MTKTNFNKNILMNILFQLVNIIYGFILPKTLIMVYGSEINGLVSVTLQIIGYMKIVEAGLSAASIRQFYTPLLNNNAKQISDLFQSVNYYYKKIAQQFIGLSFIGGIVYSLLANTSIHATYVFLLVMVMALSTYFDFAFANKYYVYFLANKEIFKFQMAQVVTQIIKILVVSFFSFYHIDAVLLLLTITLLTLFKIYLLAKAFKKENIRLTSKFTLIPIDQRNSVLTHQILGSIIYNSPIILISILINAKIASIFAIYNLVFTTFYSFFTLIYSQSILPNLGHLLSKKDYKYLKVTHEKYNKYSILLNLVIITTTLITFKSFIEIYTEGADITYYAYSATVLFSLYTSINCFKVPYQTLANANGDFRNTIIHSVIEVIIFLLTIIILYKYISMDVIILGLLLSCIYKMLSLKIFSNVHIIKESWKQHYFQLIAIGFLSVIILYLPKLQINANSLVQWVIYSTISVFFILIFTSLLILLPDFVINLINRKNSLKNHDF